MVEKVNIRVVQTIQVLCSGTVAQRVLDDGIPRPVGEVGDVVQIERGPGTPAGCQQPLRQQAKGKLSISPNHEIHCGMAREDLTGIGRSREPTQNRPGLGQNFAADACHTDRAVAVLVPMQINEHDPRAVALAAQPSAQIEGGIQTLLKRVDDPPHA